MRSTAGYYSVGGGTLGIDFKRWWGEMWRKKRMTTADAGSICIDGLTVELYIRELAFWTCVNLISNAISKCEFKTYWGGEEVKKTEYWIWNYEPNRNQSSSAFLHKLISKLYSEGECLVVEMHESLFVCDSYQVVQNVVYGNSYTDIVIDGKEFNRGFPHDEVLFFRLSEANLRALLNGMYSTYQNLISSAMSGYASSKGFRGVYTYDAIPPSFGNDHEKFVESIKKRFRNFMGSDNAVLPLGKGEGFENLLGKTTVYETTRDIRALIDDITDYTARAMLIPPMLLNGAVQETSTAMDQFLTLCIDPLADLIEEEINRKRYGYRGFQGGRFLKVDTKAIKHVDLLDAAPNIERLISSGPFTINDVRKLVGEAAIDEPWANQHFITRNFATVDEVLRALTTTKEESA